MTKQTTQKKEKKIQKLEARDPMEGNIEEVLKEVNARLNLLWFKVNEIIERLNDEK